MFFIAMAIFQGGVWWLYLLGYIVLGIIYAFFAVAAPIAKDAAVEYLELQKNTRNPDKMLNLAYSSDYQTRKKLALSVGKPYEILKILSEDENYRIRKIIANDEYTPLDILQILSSDSAKSVRAAANRSIARIEMLNL